MSDVIKDIMTALGEHPTRPPVRYTKEMVSNAYARNLSVLTSIFAQRFTRMRMVKLKPGKWQNVGHCFTTISALLTQNKQNGDVIKYLQADAKRDDESINDPCTATGEDYRMDSYYIEQSSSTIFQVNPAIPCGADVWVTVIGVLDINPMLEQIEENNKNPNRKFTLSLKLSTDINSLVWWGVMADLLGTNINSSVALNQSKTYYERYDKTLRNLIIAENKIKKVTK